MIKRFPTGRRWLIELLLRWSPKYGVKRRTALVHLCLPVLLNGDFNGFRSDDTFFPVGERQGDCGLALTCTFGNPHGAHVPLASLSGTERRFGVDGFASRILVRKRDVCQANLGL